MTLLLWTIDHVNTVLFSLSVCKRNQKYVDKNVICSFSHWKTTIHTDKTLVTLLILSNIRIINTFVLVYLFHIKICKLILKMVNRNLSISPLC